MSYSVIAALILTIATEFGIPPYFALSIALQENPTLSPLAVNVNENGTVDRGIMQLNSSWYNGDWQNPETNIREGCNRIKQIMRSEGVYTFWAVAVCYNAGYGKLDNPPERTIEYANRIMLRWQEMDKVNFRAIIPGKK
jgi:soluble lytic murein transglycosylase-like protein